jgi:hypothetical protein
MRPARTREHRAEEAGARGRHPTALWVPDLEEMRRRALARTIVTPPAYQHDDEPA